MLKYADLAVVFLFVRILIRLPQFKTIRHSNQKTIKRHYRDSQSGLSLAYRSEPP